MNASLVIDEEQVATFVTDLFKYAEPGEYVSLRGFDQFRRDVPLVLIKAVSVERDLSSIIAAAVTAARTCAEAHAPAVFAPPICTFANAERARVVDLASGLALSVEIDDADPDDARATLEGLLGAATLVVSSGSLWTDPATGELKPKIHIHWRLNEPTTTAEEHQRLRQARDLAARLVGADPTGKPVVHPLRWPGSWNRKAAPRMARIVLRNQDAEISLGDALERLEEAVDAAGFEDTIGPRVSSDPQAPVELVLSALAVIPNSGTGVHYDEWIRLGYALVNAIGGTDEALTAYHAWSAKSDKYDAGETDAAWSRINAAIIGANTSSKVGAGTIFFLAKQAGWQRTGANAESATPDDAPSGAESKGDVTPVKALVAEFNVRYMVVNEAGKAIVYEPEHDVLLNRRYYRRITFDDLKRLYLNRRICLGRDGNGKQIFKPVADLWLGHADRRQFIGGVTFNPSGQHVRPDTLNLWQGFAVQPRTGTWKRLHDHILEVICCGNLEHYNYLINWMARLVQCPGEQGEVAIVMRGGEGTGKGTLAKALLHIFGQHGLAISNSKHLTGNFNGHLRDTVLLFADEAFFAGDRAHVGILKTLITEPYLTIEAKYQNAVQMPNFVHLMMASNEDWVVPASLDARRFLVLEVSSARANDHAYFAAIWEEMDAGGYQAMLHDLLEHNLTTFNPRRVPVTVGLQAQRKLSLPTAEDWWMDVLMRGYVYKSRLGLEEYFGKWHEQMTTGVLFESYIAHAKTRSERHPIAREAFGKFMVRMGATASKQRNAVVGEHITDINTAFGASTRKAALIEASRAHGFRLGELSSACSGFELATGLTMEWPTEGEDT